MSHFRSQRFAHKPMPRSATNQPENTTISISTVTLEIKFASSAIYIYFLKIFFSFLDYLKKHNKEIRSEECSFSDSQHSIFAKVCSSYFLAFFVKLNSRCDKPKSAVSTFSNKVFLLLSGDKSYLPCFRFSSTSPSTLFPEMDSSTRIQRQHQFWLF